MARTKREQDRSEKRDEIVTAARKLFLEEGFETASMSKLAKLAGVAPNTIYWYFKDKDEVLIAVADVELMVGMAAYTQQIHGDLADRLLWIVNQFEVLNELVNAVHARMKISAVVSTWHERFHLLSENILRAEFANRGIAPDRVEARIKTCVFAIEGMLSHSLPDEMKRAVCSELATL